jgi:transposase
VPSLHDAKSAAIIAKLHIDGASTPWGPLSEEKRELKAAIATMDLYREQHQRLIHSLESSLARYWPELTEHLELSSATLVALLARVGGPRDVAGVLEQSRRLLHGMSHGLMSQETIEAVLQSATSSAGVRLLPQERVALMTLAAEAHRALKEFKKAKLAVERLSTSGAAQRLAPTTGKATAAVLVADVGDPRDYPSTRAYLKGYGLNLKEKSSGKQKGQLSITKRGPGRARQYLWLAVFRWLQKDAVARAWYADKIKRDGGRRARAVIALMRKFAQALFHVARGVPLVDPRPVEELREQVARRVRADRSRGAHRGAQLGEGEGGARGRAGGGHADVLDQGRALTLRYLLDRPDQDVQHVHAHGDDVLRLHRVPS